MLNDERNLRSGRGLGRWAGGYAFAVAATAAALLFRLTFADLGDRAPFFPFVVATLLTAWYGGRGPGLLATMLGAALGAYFSLPPANAPLVEQLSRPTVTGLFTVIGVVASWLCGSLHAARRRTEEKQRHLEQAEERVRSVVDHAIDGIITFDENGTVESFNPAAERIFGYRADEIIGQSVKLIAPYFDAHDRFGSSILLPGQGRGDRIGQELTGRRKDGSTFPMDLAVSDFHLHARRCFTAIVRDVTERKRAEEVLKEADKRKDEFLATLAHELRNPLAPIRNTVELLRRGDRDAELVAQAGRILERQVGQLTRLVDDLLDISRISRGKVRLRRERVELAAVVTAALEAARPILDAQGHALTVTVPPEPLFVDADPHRLTQVFVNLLDNAAKYTDRGGHVWLSAWREGVAAVVSVRDSGIGIAAEYLPRLFQMFSQAAPALERTHGGLGIGLALVKGLVELHGGAVEAHSSGPGTGSEFIVRLPLARAPLAAEPDVPAEQPAARPSLPAAAAPTRRVLVVDDNHDTADSLASVLRLAGHDTRQAYDGQEAVQTAAAFRPDVVVLDIGLPRLNGYEAARHLRGQPWGKDLLLVALTGWGQDEDKRRAAEAGFDHHLTKPVEPAALEELLAAGRPGEPAT